jgi:hypothetical protein
MKKLFVLLGAGMASLLMGCSSVPVAFAPVGPNPLGSESTAGEGQLQVFSGLTERSDNQNQASDDPVWYQHTDYRIYDLHGKLVKRVNNTIGHYEQAPRQVALPAGRYVIKAEAGDYSMVQVPVTIERGRTTRVHLDDNWNAPADTPRNELVGMPNGKPAGWRADSTNQTAIN